MATKTSNDETSAIIRRVELSGMAALKIIQHCRTTHPANVTGQLLGFDQPHGTMEVTDAFAFPGTGDQEEEEGAEFQVNMMRCLRENNVDNNTAGWYQASGDSSFQTTEFVRTAIGFAQQIPQPVVAIVYNHQAVTVGQFPLKAIAVTPQFAKAFKGGNSQLTYEKLSEQGVRWADVLVELPLTITNTALAQSLVARMRATGVVHAASTQHLHLGTTDFLTKNLGQLAEMSDDLMGEMNKVTKYHKTLTYYQTQMDVFRAKRRAENAERRARGEDLLPEEDASFFKAIEPPTMVEHLLISNQVAALTDQINAFTKQSMARMHIASEL